MNHDNLLRKLDNDFSINDPSAWDRIIPNWENLPHSHQHIVIGLAQASAGILQRSVLSPILFTTYVSPISRMLDCHSIKYHMYADYTQLYTTLLVPINPNLQIPKACTSILRTGTGVMTSCSIQINLKLVSLGQDRLQNTHHCFCCWVQY